MKDCTTCKYGYEDERLGIPMCHHPKRFSEDCVDFNMHEEKEIKEPEKPMQEDLEKEIDKIWETCDPVDEGMGVETANIHIEQFDYLARHFAQWGAEHAMEKMMEESLEGKIFEENYGPHRKVISEWTSEEIGNQGDKVKIIVIHETDIR